MDGTIQTMSKAQEDLVSQILITLVRECPWIYSRGHKDYKDDEKKLRKFQEFAQQIEQVTDLEITSGLELSNLWKKLYAKYLAEKSKINQPSCSGNRAPEILPTWELYNEMTFLDAYNQAREVKSSLDLKSKTKRVNEAKVPPSDNHSKKKQLESELDKELVLTSQLLRKSLVEYAANDEQRQGTSQQLQSTKDDDDWCNAVLKTFDTLPDNKKLEGLVLTLSEILLIQNEDVVMVD